MGWYVVYLFLCFITSFVMTMNGYGIDTWQWWVVCLCQVFSYVCGRAVENSLR